MADTDHSLLSSRTPDLCAEHVPAVLLELTGAVHALRYPPQGMTSDVAIVEGERGVVVVKRARAEPFRAWLLREHKVLLALVGAPFPLPASYGCLERETAEGPEVWLAMQRLPGQSLRVALSQERRPDVRRALLTGYGALLRAIHQAPIPPRLTSERPWLDRMLEQAAGYLASYEVEGSPELLERLRRERPMPLAETLIHGDLTLDNVLVEDGAITGVIDWALGGAGDPRYDVTLAREPDEVALGTPAEQAAFFAGYGGAPLTDAEYQYFTDLYEFF